MARNRYAGFVEHVRTWPRATTGLLAAVGSAAVLAAACGTSGISTFPDEVGSGDGGQAAAPPAPAPGFGGTDAGSAGEPDAAENAGGEIDPTSMRIEPADAVVTVSAGQSLTQSFKVFGKYVGGAVEEDITARCVFYVPDNFLVGGFPLDGGPVFTSRVPSAASDPSQRGGKLTVQATAANQSGTIEARTSLTVKLTAALTPANASLPVSPATKFTGAPVAARKPQLVYPNDGTMLPPNLRRLEVQWRPGSSSNALFELAFESSSAEVVYYTRCGGGAPDFLDDTCAFELDEAGYGYLAESNRGTGPIRLVVRATDDAGTAHGASDPFAIEFAENRVDGGLYYWTVTTPERIMRFDFGAAGGSAEPFVVRNQDGVPDSCPGCHALSRQGTKMVASIGGQWDGRLLFIDDLSKPKTATDRLTVAPDSTAGGINRVQFASFNPDGTKFVAVYGDVGGVPTGARDTLVGSPTPPDPAADVNKLFFHDGATGLRESEKVLPFKPNHPDWSPDGETIALTRVGNPNTSTQKPGRTSIAMLKRDGAGFGDPITVVPEQQDYARYNPSFVPESSFFYYSESFCPGNWDGPNCDADADPTARTWAVVPAANATPVLLVNAAKGGVADGSASYLGDTFPRSAPFKTKHRDGQLFWFTVASRRKVGRRVVGGAQHLWMFAVDPAKVLAGQDGSYAGFYLPFQDLTTSNHIGQWTEKIVGGLQPPPAPSPPPPPPPTPPPAGPK